MLFQDAIARKTYDNSEQEFGRNGQSGGTKKGSASS